VSLSLLLRCDERGQRFTISGLSRDSHEFLGSRDVSLSMNELAVITGLLETGELQSMLDAHEFARQVTLGLAQEASSPHHPSPGVREPPPPSYTEGAQMVMEKASMAIPGALRFPGAFMHESKAPQGLDIGRLEGRSFSIVATLRIEHYHYGMIASKDRSCVGSDQFRWELHGSGHMAVAGLGVDGGHPGPKPHSRDPNGWSMSLTSANKVPLRTRVRVALVRGPHHIRLYMAGQAEGEVAVNASKAGMHMNQLDLRIGSRFPPEGGSMCENPFPGDVDEALFVWHALTPEEAMQATRDVEKRETK
jgi:hypothetical protein